MELSDFVGNQNEVRGIIDWLDNFYNKGIKESNYIILVGTSGNGKSLIPELLAKKFNVELFSIAPYSITSGDDLNNIIKSINISPLDFDEKPREKLILIDDIDEHHFRYKKRLYAIPEISRYPVIFTSKIFKFPDDFKHGSHETTRYGRKSWYFQLKKPSPTLLCKYLMSINKDVSYENALKIAKQSKSVRSAVLSFRNNTINTLLSEDPSPYEVIKSISERRLQVPITRKNINWIFHSIRGVKNGGTIHDLYAVSQKFCDFEHRITFYHETYDDKMTKEGIDPMFVNYMEEPIEKIKWELQLYKKKKKPKKEDNITKKVVKKKTEVEKPQPLDEWGF